SFRNARGDGRVDPGRPAAPSRGRSRKPRAHDRSRRTRVGRTLRYSECQDVVARGRSEAGAGRRHHRRCDACRRRRHGAGGAFDVKDFSLDWPPLSVAGNGTVALDEHLQPEGAFSTRIGGYSEAIDALVAQNDLDARGGALAKGVLGLLSKNSTNGGREIQVSVTVQDQRLSVGPLQLLTLPAVSWPIAAVP